jgi:hypothetical protein
MKDVSKCYGIMPFAHGNDVFEWWLLEYGNKVLSTGHSREEAFAKALEHNKAQGVPAVYVMGLCAKHGSWKQG